MPVVQSFLDILLIPMRKRLVEAQLQQARHDLWSNERAMLIFPPNNCTSGRGCVLAKASSGPRRSAWGPA
jgi:hypothetical protein